MSFNVKDVLYTAAYHAAEIEKVLSKENPSFLEFDPVLGYVMHDHAFNDGMRGTLSTYRFESPGNHRKIINCPELPCRINTYGDSYTMCAQVSDGETWQEILAAHFREPIRNYGVGGYGVYEAYNKAMQVEQTDQAAEYIILNIWDDDYMRNLDAARWNRVAWMCRDLPRGKKDGYPVHGFPWAHLRYDLGKGEFVEKEGLLKDASELWKLVGKENYYNAFKDDHVVHLYTLREGGDAPVEFLEKLAEAFNMKVDLRNPQTRAADARKLHYTYGIKSTEYLVDKMQKWADENNRKLMIILSYDVPTVMEYIEKGARFDQEFVEFLNNRQYPYIDFLPKTKEDYKSFNLELEPYLERFYIERAGAQVFGHYNPYGNFWFAHSMRDELVEWLSPKPPAYQ